ncbi:hypothetical protein ILUMI_06049 [Ignelater luminosus]|uniref:Arrestin C-terminal-like domain-containing protein n=1 Tax=Ignelater luminosus TaxID=2038154 RepID=A0A8K0DA00_IGNLU|nr:hypothetical protein ILUMI_06049 [Ignelater luminosus]
MANSIKVVLDNFNQIIYAGQTLNGKVECTFSTAQRLTVIRLQIIGYAKTEWTMKFGMIKKIYSSIESQLKYRCNLIEGEESGRIMHIPVGTYTYPFSYELPSTLPSSYEGKYGRIYYRIKVTLQPSENENYLEVPFYVVSHLNLNHFPKLKKPYVYKAKGDIKFCGYNRGPMALFISLPMTGYAVGQNIYVDAGIQNLSTINVERVEFKLIRIIKYTGDKPSMGKRHSQDVIASYTEGTIAAHAEKLWTAVLDFPSDCVLNFRSSRLMHVTYQLKVQVVLPFPHSNLNINCPIMLGTVPLRGVGTNPSEEPAVLDFTTSETDGILPLDNPSLSEERVFISNTNFSEEPVVVNCPAPETNNISPLDNTSLSEERVFISSHLSLPHAHVHVDCSDPPSYEEVMRLTRNSNPRVL